MENNQQQEEVKQAQELEFRYKLGKEGYLTLKRTNGQENSSAGWIVSVGGSIVYGLFRIFTGV